MGTVRIIGSHYNRHCKDAGNGLLWTQLGWWELLIIEQNIFLYFLFGTNEHRLDGGSCS